MSYSVLPPATSCLICCSRNSYCEASILTAIPVSVANFSVSAVSVGTCGHAGAKMLMVEFCATVCPGRITDGMASAAAAAEVVFTRVRRVIITERNCSRSNPVFSRSAFDIEPSSSARLSDRPNTRPSTKPSPLNPLGPSRRERGFSSSVSPVTHHLRLSPLHDVRRQHVPREVKTALDEILRALECAVLMLDADDPIISGGVKRRDQTVPAHLAQPRQAWDFPTETAPEDAVLVEHLAVDLQILGMDMKDAVLELGDRAHLIDKLPDQMRGIVIEPEVLVWDDLEHAPPNRRRIGDVGAAGPRIRPEHGAILDGDLHPTLARVVDDRRPDASEVLQILLGALVLVGPGKGADDLDPKQRRGIDHRLQVRDHLVTVRLVRVERVWVIRQRGDLQIVISDDCVDLPRLGRIEIRNVDVADAAIAAILFADWPAGDLKHAEAALGRPLRDLFQAHRR